MRFLRDRVFPRRSLERVVSPTPVRLSGTIATQDARISPVTGAGAALLRWALFDEELRPLFSGLLCAAGRGLLVVADSATIEIPLEGIDLRLLPARVEPETVLLTEIPAALVEAIPNVAVAAPLFYRERLVRHGARVRLHATVSVPCRGVGSPYRVSPRIDYTAHGRVRLDVLE